MRFLTRMIILFSVLAFNACSLSDMNSGAATIDSNTQLGYEHLFHPALPRDVNLAIATSDYRHSSIERLTLALDTLSKINSEQAQHVQAAIYGHSLSASAQISWNPTHDSAIFAHTIGVNHPIFIANDSPSGDTSPMSLGIAGYKHGTPYLALGSNPFRTAQANASTVNDDMMQAMNNAVDWLTDNNGPLKHALFVNLDDSYYFRDYPTTKAWLIEQFGEDITINQHRACDDNKLSHCLDALEKPDLIVVSQNMNEESDLDALAAQIDLALQQGIPVLYLHWYRETNPLGTPLLSALQVQFIRHNYWSQHRITDYSVADLRQHQDPISQSMVSMMQKLASDDWTFDLTACNDNCTNQSMFKTEFEDIAKAIQNRLRYFDRHHQAIFAEPSHEFDKLLVLLADAYRAGVEYPLDVKTSSRTDFLQAYYADFAQYLTRSANSHPANMGNFSRTDFPDVQTFATELETTSRIPFRSAGLYALPAQTVTITRLDNSDTEVSVFINTIRDGATHEWDEKGYKRPKFLRSTSIELKPNMPVTITPSYGGTLQLAFSKNHLPVNVRFEGVAQHPVWRSEDDNNAFQSALLAHQFDWAEILTPAFEVHSRHDLMMETIQDHPQWPTGGAIANATMIYLHNYPHVLAGFKGPGINEVEEVHSFARQHGLAIDELDLVKHMNADQALCGYGCSGNPYDAYWSFSPIGHGDIHELGHGLERHRFRMTDAQGNQMEVHAITNPYSYYSKTQYHKATGGAPSCQKLPFKAIFDDLTSDQQNGWNSDISLSAWNRGMATYLQFMMTAEAQGALTDGWHLWPRFHIIEREFNRAVRNDDAWADKQTSVGFAGMTLDYAKNISNNDWMLIAVSHATQLDYRPLFEMYGLATTTQAKNRVSAMNLSPTDAVFYRANDDDYCYGLDKPSLTANGAW